MIAPHIIERARSIRIEDEVAKRGIKLKGGIDQRGPCPVCGGTDRFSINLGKQCFNCRGCGIGGDVIAMVQHIDGCTFAESVEILTGDDLRPQSALSANKQTSNTYEADQHRKAAWLWSQRKPITGSIAERYLRSRCITCLPATLGFLPSLKPEHHPTLIAAFAVVDEPEPGVCGKPQNVSAVHLTLLKADGGGKAEVEPNKIIIGSPRGLPIILAPPNDLMGLAITEGIEDALTAHQATGLGVWAAGSAGFMPKLAGAVPNFIAAVTIFGHPDEAGQDGARRLAVALRKRGVEVTVEGLP